ncbi:hypothetical protein [Catellatospora sp. NPDC049609]|uniref:hypothetical protein n=1 Tax=Catellatospora sp. NPDC049609 TaxID=3155505 RepID=UPI00341C7D77
MRGLRARIGPAGLALWTALTIGAMGLQAGAWLGWRGAPPLPSDQVAVGLTQDAAGDLTAAAVRRDDELFGYEYDRAGDPALWLVGTDERYLAGAVRVSYALPEAAVEEDVIAAARHRLGAAGWQVGGDAWTVTAYRDGWHLVAVDEYRSWYNDIEGPSLVMSVVRGEPSRVGWFALGGLLLGLVPGWWLAGALRRSLRYGGVLLGLNLFLLTPQVLIGGAALGRWLWRDPAAPPEAAWGVNNELGASCGAGLAGVLFAALLIGAAMKWHRTVEKTVPTSVRLRAALFRESLR